MICFEGGEWESRRRWCCKLNPDVYYLLSIYEIEKTTGAFTVLWRMVICNSVNI